jgi:hypothetical protein
VFLGDVVRSNYDESWFLWPLDVVVLGGVIGVADFIGWWGTSLNNTSSRPELAQISSLFNSIFL